LFEGDVLLGQRDHTAAGHATRQSVVLASVLLELAGAADQQATTAVLGKLAPDQRRRQRTTHGPRRRLAQFRRETLYNNEENK